MPDPPGALFNLIRGLLEPFHRPVSQSWVMPEKKIGIVEHYYPKAQAAAVHLSAGLKVGDQIHIVGHGDDLVETVTSLQKDHAVIPAAKRGQHIGVWVPERVHEGDEVYRVES